MVSLSGDREPADYIQPRRNKGLSKRAQRPVSTIGFSTHDQRDAGLAGIGDRLVLLAAPGPTAKSPTP